MTSLDLELLRTAKSFSDTTESLLKNYKRLKDELASHEADMVGFGNYLLSKLRRDRFIELSEENLEERLSKVHHADMQNWIEMKNRAK